MRRLFIFAFVSFALLISAISHAEARTFNDYECTDDCSGHAAGYCWAEEHNITNESDCPLTGNANSFYEGCLVYVDDPNRGSDEDDDGDPID